MKKKQLATWTPWERDEDSSSAGILQAAAIRVTVVTTSGKPGDGQVEVLELEGLRWGFELSVVPGPDEPQ